MSETKTAWDEIFKRRGHVFWEPHEDMARVCALLQQHEGNRVLDLGCGTGRHVILLARRQFDVYGIDNSESGLQLAREWLQEESLSASLRLGDFEQPLPYEDGFFDGVISVQVIHHARIATIQQVIGEIERILKPGGLVFVTVPTRKNQAENFEQVEPNTFIPLDGPEKGLPHHYFSEAELRRCFRHFEIVDLHVDKYEHFCLLGTRLPDE